jgi:hypothetical protein
MNEGTIHCRWKLILRVGAKGEASKTKSKKERGSVNEEAA